MISALDVTLLVLAACPSVYYILSLYCIFDFFRAARTLPAKNSTFLPSVSILKPVRGVDRDAYENFASYCVLDYPKYEIIFAVADSERPGNWRYSETKTRFSPPEHPFGDTCRAAWRKQQSKQFVQASARSSI